MSQAYPPPEEEVSSKTPWGMIIGVLLAIFLVCAVACGGVIAVVWARAAEEGEKIVWEAQRDIDGAIGEVVYDKQMRADAADQASAALRNFKYTMLKSPQKPRIYADGKMYEIYGTAKKSGKEVSFVVELELTRSTKSSQNWTLEEVQIDGETTWTRPETNF